MDLKTILLLSLIQGITEFLPVSSSAHLMLFPFLFNISDQGVITDIFAHFGSLFAVIYFYRQDIKEIFLSIFSKKDKTMFYSLIIATFPIFIIGLLFFIFKIVIALINDVKRERGNPPPLTRSTGCNIVVLLAIHFAILLIAPRAFCSLHRPQDAVTNAHPPYFVSDKTGMISFATFLVIQSWQPATGDR